MSDFKKPSLTNLPGDILKYIASQDLALRLKEDLLREKIRLLHFQDFHLQEKTSHLQNQIIRNESLEAENAILREALRLARMRQFAATSEKLPSTQYPLLFNEVEAFAEKNPEGEGFAGEESKEEIVVPAHTRKVAKRQALPDHLPREEVVIDIPDEEKICPEDGSPLKEIGSEVSEQLDYVPASLKVIRTIRKKYACPCCEETIRTGANPEKILPKTMAAPGLLAHIAVSKYADALPLYRLEGILKRSGIEIPRQTLASWMIALSEKLQVVYNFMEEDLLASGYVCCDETKVQVLKEVGKKAQSLSYMWVRARYGPDLRPIILFDYDPTRSGEVPKKLLEGFKGYLQVDGYAGYDAVCKRPDIVRVGCMAHARRNFFDAYQANGKKEGPEQEMIRMIQGLYAVEEKIRDLSIEERKRIRQEESEPILKKMKESLDENEKRHPPQGLLGKAIGYAKNQWPTLIRYVEDGRLAIDNNFIENRIRPFAIGRKNWLFSDTVKGAQASAMLYSMIQTARASGLEPYAYLRYLFTHLPSAKTADQIESLLPHTIDPKKLY